MNLKGILLIFISVLILFLGILMFFKHRKSLINIWYGLVMLSGSLWSFGLFMFMYVDNLNISIFWARLFYLAAAGIAYSFLNFAIYFPFKDINYNFKYKILTAIPFFIMIYLIFFTQYLIFGIESLEWGNSIILGSGYYFYILYFVVYILSSFIIWSIRYRTSTKIDKVRLKYILISTGIALSFGSFFNLFLPIVTYQYVWIGPLALIIMAILIFYAISRFRLLNIRLIIVRAILHTILVAFVAGFFALSVAFTGYFLEDYAGVSKVLVYFIDGLIIVLFLEPVKRIWAKITDNIFYKDRIDHQSVLRRLGLIIAREIELNNLLNKLVNFLREELKVNIVSSIVLTKKNNIVVSSDNKKVKFDLNEEMINYLLSHDDIIITDELIKESKEERSHFKLNHILKELELNNIDLLIPIIKDNKLISVILLSNKLSGDIYNDGDIDLFKTLKPQIAIAIEKANLYQKLELLNIDLEGKVEEKTKDLEDVNDALEERNNFLITIQSIINTTSRTLDLREATQMIANSISSKLGYVGGILSFVNEEKGILHAGALTENERTIPVIKMLKQDPKSFIATLKEEYNLGTKTVLHGQITFSDKMSDYFSPPVDKEIMNTIQDILKVKTVVGVPVYSKGKTIGLVHYLFEQERKDISPLDMELMTTLADQVGIISRNLTLYENLQKTNKQLQDANVHLRHLDKAKSEFLSIASHQLRTPISALKGYLSMILDGDFGKIPIKIKKVLADLFDSSSRLARVINIFLNVSRIESGKFHLDKKPAKINDLIIAVIKELQNEAKQKSIILDYKKSCRKKELISLVDSDKLREVILNLIDNAIKYTNKGKIKIRLACEENSIKFSVKDTGIGIDKDDIPLLFKKFSRGTGVSNIYTGGSGLGLFIAQKVIKEHGGEIWVESKGKGRGSIFSFSLPICDNNECK